MRAAIAPFVLAILAACAFGAPARVENLFSHTDSPPSESQIDRLVLNKLHQAHIEPAGTCSDAVFIRRVYLDTIGMLPGSQEVRDFLQDKNPNKRRLLIERLLERDEFADYQAMHWADMLRIKAEFPINLWPNAAQGYHRWIRTAIHDNHPYDRIARALLVANGSNFRTPEVNFYRALPDKEPKAIARMVALTFMGTRAEKWPGEQLDGLARFFSQVGYKYTAEWKEEIVYWDAAQAATRPAAVTALLPDGTSVTLDGSRDPRAVFADWLVDAKNPFFARAMANRIWCWLLGRGIVQEADDFRADNPPVNPELLAYLERQFVAHKYDLKYLYRLILNSRTYQSCSIAKSDKAVSEANFATYSVRRLDAEVLIDAICQLSGTSENYTSAIPEPYTFVPAGERAVALPDASISSSFLQMFGRSNRDTGLMEERNNRPSAEQALHLLNSTHIQKKIEAIPGSVMKGKTTPRDVATELYLKILSRLPTNDELEAVQSYWKDNGGRGAAIDLTWALINSAEFLYRH